MTKGHWIISPQGLAFLGLLVLAFCPFLLSVGAQQLADYAAAWAWVFLGGGVLWSLVNLYHRDRREK